MAYIYNLTDTWNAGGTTFYGIRLNVTNTASASGSRLLSLQVSGSEVFGVAATGQTGLGTASPNASAMLDITSTTRGFLPPRMTTAQRDAISTPADGLILYNSTTNKLQVRAASSWIDLH